MDDSVSKSRFKPRALEYFRKVQASKKPLIITDHGEPVLRIVPFAKDPARELQALRGSVLRYESPTEPVGLSDWEVLE